MTNPKIDPLFQAITANLSTLSVVWLTNLNQYLELVILISSIAFAFVKWRDYLIKIKSGKRVDKKPKV